MLKTVSINILYKYIYYITRGMTNVISFVSMIVDITSSTFNHFLMFELLGIS